MKAKEYELIYDCIDDGVIYGLNRAYKHTETPTKEQLHAALVDAIMLEINEWFEFKENI
jgi:hypothetical protein